MGNIQVNPELLMEFFEGGFGRVLGLREEDQAFALTVANSKLSVGDALSAIKIYSLLVYCNPSNYAHLQGLAAASIKVLDYESAFRTAALMTALQPQNALGHYFAGAAFLHSGHRAEAVSSLTKACRLTEQTAMRQVCEALLLQAES